MPRKSVVQSKKLTEVDSEEMWKMWHVMLAETPLPDMEGYSHRDAAYLGFCRGVMLKRQACGLKKKG